MSNWWDKFAPPPPAPNADNPTWYYKFAPKTIAPVVQTVPPSTSELAGESMQVEDAILLYNNNLSQFTTNPIVEWVDSAKGVVIHKIDLPTAAAISTRVKPSASQYELPLTYVLGCLAIESTLDPACENGNLGPGESNVANDPLGYDVGIAQFKLRYLVGYAPGCVDAATARAFALDVNRAIPYFCSLMASKYLWAQNTIQGAGDSSAPDPRLRDPYLLATGAYNFGETGMLTYFENGTFPTHCQHVLDLERYFAAKIGVASIFTALV